MELNIKLSSVSELSSLVPILQTDTANRKLDLIMSKLTDILAKEQELKVDVETLITAQNASVAKISELNDIIKNSTMSDEDKAAAEKIFTDLNDLDTEVKSVIAPPTT